MNRPEAIVILTPGFAGSEADTTCLPMQQRLVRSLCRNHPQLKIFVLAFHYPFRRGSYHWEGATVISFNGGNKKGLHTPLLHARVHRALKELHASHRLAGLLSFWYGPCAAVASRFARRHRLVHRCWILGQDARAGNRYPRVLRLAGTELVALSDRLADEFEKNHGLRPAHTIPPGIDPAEWKGTAATRDVDLIGVGSLIQLKQFNVFVEVLAAMKRQRPGIRGVIAGDGPLREELQGLARELGLENNLLFAGMLSYPEVIQLMKRSRILLHPSSYEGFSGVCQEALAAGAHVISFTSAMNHEIGQWHLVDAKNEMEALAASILDDEGASYGQTIPYTIDQTAARLAGLFGL